MQKKIIRLTEVFSFMRKPATGKAILGNFNRKEVETAGWSSTRQK